MNIGGLSNRFLIYKTKRFWFGKRVIGLNINDSFFSHLAYACVRESVRARDMGCEESHLIYDM